MNNRIRNKIYRSLGGFFSLLVLISPSLFSQEVDRNCESNSELIDILRNSFEDQMKQVYDVSNDEEIYSSFLNFLSFDPLVNSWFVNISKTDVPESLKRHNNFQKIWTNDQKESDIILEEVISNDGYEEENEKSEIWDVDTESNYFNCLKKSNSKKFVLLLDDIEAIGGFISPRMHAGLLLRILEDEDYTKEEVQNFIAINLYFTTLLNLSQN